ncbi:hypothetical protein [Microseira sp. BLCC-F43]|uniref:hypothetical protein n=1 Tax=Microseira sp. BLCC-F43 TaxID=3153602 RepID=UPI0035B95662
MCTKLCLSAVVAACVARIGSDKPRAFRPGSVTTLSCSVTLEDYDTPKTRPSFGKMPPPIA